MTDDEGIDYEALREIVTAAVKPAGALSSRALSLTASSGRNPDLIRNFLKNGTRPSFQSVFGICDALELSPVLFLRDWTGGVPERRSWLPVNSAVEAGVWRDKIVWEQGEWYDINVPHYNADRPFNGCLVRGRSMDRVLPVGTVLKCGVFNGSKAQEVEGSYVIVARRTGSLRELTCRRLVQDRIGHWELRQESYLPEYAEPLRIDLEEDDLGVASVIDIAGIDVEIVARVVEAFNPLGSFATRPSRKYGPLPAFSD